MLKEYILSCKNRLPEVISYISLLYYIEIIYMMLVLVIIFGKTVSLAAGFAATLLLAFHLISLNMRKPFSLRAQLVIMEIHFALSAAFILNLVNSEFAVYSQDMLITVVRIVLAVAELPLIYLLSGDNSIELFSKTH